MSTSSPPASLSGLLSRFVPDGEAEVADVSRVLGLLATTDDPWPRDLPLHVTASALVVHPASSRVLLRWHQRQQAWLHVGGHADPGESDPLAIALREGHEETGLTDLVAWPDAELQQVAIVSVPASSQEPAHEHADVRFFLATRTPDAIQPESPDAPLRWLSLAAAREATTEANMHTALLRAERLLAAT